MFLDIFNSAENQQYFKDETNLIWLHGTLLCKKLGFKNVSQAIQMHTEEDERQQIIVSGRAVWFVSEYGVWGLILESKTEEALAFKRKLKREILPKLRTSAYYIASEATSEQLEAAEIEIHKLKFELQTVKNKGVGLSNLVELIMTNIQYDNTPQRYVSSNEWLNMRVLPMFPTNKFRSRFARNVSELYKSVYSQIPTKHEHQMYVENYGDYIDVKSNLYLVPLDLPILEHAFKTVCDWFMGEGSGFLREHNQQMQVHPYA